MHCEHLCFHGDLCTNKNHGIEFESSNGVKFVNKNLSPLKQKNASDNTNPYPCKVSLAKIFLLIVAIVVKCT